MGDDVRTGRLATACNARNIEKVKREIEDRRKMIRDVTDSTNVLCTSVHKHPQQNLEMKKVSSKLVLKVLIL